MATDISICSNALLELGQTPISSFNDGTDKSRLAANLYPPNREAVLRSHTWNCCTARAQLAPLADGPAYGFAYRFLLPGDWGRTLKVGQAGDFSTDFRHEGRYLLSNSNALLLRYVRKTVSEGEFDSLLVDVLTARMKWKFTYAVTKSTALRDSNEREYLRVLQQAKSIDSMEEPSEQVAEESPLISVRY